MTGDIRQLGDKLVINVRLIGSDDSHVWGTQYVRAYADVIDLQNEISREISKQLGIRLANANDLAKWPTNDPEAYRLFLMGRHHAEKYTPADMRKALGYYEQAVLRDADFAEAHAGIAAACFYLAGSPDFPSKVMIDRARNEASRAIALDPDLPAAHEVYSFLLSIYDHDHLQAENEIRKALELAPNDASAHESYGTLLTMLGRFDEAIRELRTAAELDPLSASVTSSLGQTLALARRYDEAERQLTYSLELDRYFVAAHNGLSIVHQMQQNFQAVAEDRARIFEIIDNAEGATVARESFSRDGWQGFLRALLRYDRGTQPSAYFRAVLFTALGEKEEAIQVLEDLALGGSPSILAINVDPRFDDLREHPRFAAVVRQLNLETTKTENNAR